MSPGPARRQAWRLAPHVGGFGSEKIPGLSIVLIRVRRRREFLRRRLGLEALHMDLIFAFARPRQIVSSLHP